MAARVSNLKRPITKRACGLPAHSAPFAPMSERLAIGIDLGASSIKGVLVEPDGRIKAKERLAHGSTDPAVVVATIADLAARLGAKEAGATIGVAVPGVLDDTQRALAHSANLGWEDVPLADDLERACGVPVVLEKDGAAAALGEHWAGAGRGASSTLVVMLGTGIGGGVVLGGRVWRGRTGYAGGLGHVVVAPDGPLCACGAKGCLEAVIKVRSPGAGAPGEALQALAQAEGTDPTAGALLQMALMDLAGVLAVAVSTINPERLVIGGGVLQALPRLVDRLAPLVLSRLYPKAAEGLGILPGSLGPYPAAVGAARIALDYLPV